MDIRMRFQAKRPGPTMTLEPVEMVFNQYEQKPEQQPEAYETLLYDIIEGDATLFMRADQVEAAWEAITPIMEAWALKTATGFPQLSYWQLGTGRCRSPYREGWALLGYVENRERKQIIFCNRLQQFYLAFVASHSFTAVILFSNFSTVCHRILFSTFFLDKKS